MKIWQHWRYRQIKINLIDHFKACENIVFEKYNKNTEISDFSKFSVFGIFWPKMTIKDPKAVVFARLALQENFHNFSKILSFELVFFCREMVCPRELTDEVLDI